MQRVQDWVPDSVDTSVPSMARTYDYMLGGAHNFAVDRQVGDQIEQVMPGLRTAARVNRAFLARAVRFMMDRGIRQFLDIGSGIPTVANVHEVAQSADPECRVVYVDRDPIAVAHSELMLSANDRAAIVKADLRDPDTILDHPETRRLLDFDQPIGLLMLLVLHWVPDDADPLRLMARYRDALPSGSHLAISHVSADHQDASLDAATDVIKRSKSPDQVNERTHAQITELFGDFTLLEPGLVGCGEWRPHSVGDISEAPHMNMLVYAGVAAKP
ncbi:SAM-dependent methyltransferase [Actinosynnema sp. CA-248983]